MAATTDNGNLLHSSQQCNMSQSSENKVHSDLCIRPSWS